MSYRIKIIHYGSTVEPVFDKQWSNFVKHLGNFPIFRALDDEYGAKNVPGTPYIEFKSSEDAMAFILRWS